MDKHTFLNDECNATLTSQIEWKKHLDIKSFTLLSVTTSILGFMASSYTREKVDLHVSLAVIILITSLYNSLKALMARTLYYPPNTDYINYFNKLDTPNMKEDLVRSKCEAIDKNDIQLDDITNNYQTSLLLTLGAIGVLLLPYVFYAISYIMILFLYR